MACGAAPAATLCLPTESRRITGSVPSSGTSSTAKLPMQFSRALRPFLTWSREFMYSLGSEPPPSTATFWRTPEATMPAAVMTAAAGPAQKPRTSKPLALPQPAISATALAMLPPPRCMVSPTASSEHSTTKSMSPGVRPLFLIRWSRASTPLALQARFSSMTWAERFSSVSWARRQQPTTAPSRYRGRAPCFSTASAISAASCPASRRAIWLSPMTGS